MRGGEAKEKDGERGKIDVRMGKERAGYRKAKKNEGRNRERRKRKALSREQGQKNFCPFHYDGRTGITSSPPQL